eukprot:14676301-Ditylum_brightwellii.AAC.1
MQLNINLICQNQQWRGTNSSIIQQLMQLLLCFGQLLQSHSNNHAESQAAALAIARPLSLVLGLSTNV